MPSAGVGRLLCCRADIYYGSKRHKGASREKEENLARMWTHAAVLLRPYDEDLATRCEIKGRYWADPVGWIPEELEKSRILLSEMRESLHEFTGGEARKNRRGGAQG
jgi:hypothetical protein